jgi:hypothetical protein
MNKLLLSTLCLLLFFAFSATAQSYRLQNLSGDLQRNTDEVAENIYNEFSRRYSNTRTELDNLLLAQQLKATADLFRRMVNDNRPNSELRDVASMLNDLARRGSYSTYSSYQWRQMQRNIDDIVREVGGLSSGGWDNERPPEKEVIGRVRWRGKVDDEVNLIIRGNSIEVKTLSGTQYPDGTYDFTSSLPNSQVEVSIDKKKGRGSAKLIQKPSRENNFTAVIQIRDKDGGARDYDLDIYWTR